MAIALTIGQSGTKADHQASASRSDVAAPKAPKAPQALVGDEKNPATWRLPVEDFISSRSDALKISGVRDDLIDACMSKAGYEKWQPAPDLPDLSGDSMVDRRYGVHDPVLTGQRGYHPALDVQEEYDAAIEVGAVDKSGSDPDALRACAESTDAQAPAIQSSSLVEQIDATSYTESMKDPAVVTAFARWTACMKDKGYSYKSPLEPMDDPRFSHPTTVTELEISTAKADLSCREQFDVTRTWFDAETKIQQAQIGKNLPALNAIKSENRSVAAKSAALAAAKN
ncbi:hypothetical protein OG259_08950 [Streptomyces sp. NBC_00250]|uniref:hypothetical protein n=1 Tax=Streptomyces sp. NBC_00250 TaxID=2903641 RepID=UPI002E29724D|nr:hypothetical protein [Streptomyces sp. NBC_00250]